MTAFELTLYGRLSILVGMFCARADKHLGKNHFLPKARVLAWQLTPDLLEDWKAEAILLGVPEKEISDLTVDMDTAPTLVNIGFNMQNAADKLVIDHAAAVAWDEWRDSLVR